MEKLKKIISVLLITTTIFYVNYSFASNVTNENFYDIITKLNEGFTVTTWDGESYENSNSKSRMSMDFEDFNIRKEGNKIIYTVPSTEKTEEKDVYEIEYSIEDGKLYCTCRVNILSLEYFKSKEEEGSELNMVALALGQAFILPMCVIGIANISDVIPENVYMYYTLNVQDGADSKNIFKITENETDTYTETKMEVDLEKFVQIDNTYFENTSSCKITYTNQDLSTGNKKDEESENKAENENKETNNTSSENKENNTNTNTNTNTKKEKNENTNTNTNTNSKVNLDRNINKNNASKNTNTKNSNKTDNTTSKIQLPKAGTYEVGFLIVAVCMIGLYSYKKYTDILK